MVAILIIAFLIVSTLAVLTNPDIFSPAKLYLFFFLLFHAGIVTTDISSLTGVLIGVVLLMGLWIAILEAGRLRLTSGTLRRPQSPAATGEASKDHTLFLWLVSAPPIFAQLYMIQEFGGLEGYIASIGLRVVEWSGFGWARMLIVLMIPINVAYFALTLRKKRSMQVWALYAAHLSIVVLMGALSGSRSILLNVFLMQFVVFHYVRSNVSVAKASMLAVALIMSAMVLGVVRNTIRYSAGEFSTAGASSDTFSFAAFTYGVYPLEVIATTGYMPLAEGSTFLSAITNVIPRDIWPGKPDSGGVFFTEYYLGDAWQGYSYYTPTFLGEWLINFGWFAGVIGYILSYGMLFYFSVRYYFYITRTSNSNPSDVRAVDIVIYVHFLLSAIALMVGELTNVFVTLMVSQLLPLIGIRQYMKWTSPQRSATVIARRDHAGRPELASGL